MNLEKNTIPDDVKHIHLIAICGTAMGALACMLKQQGYTVTGSDQKVYPPMSDFLRQQGITLIEGFDPSNLNSEPDLVVIGNAVKKDNPEVSAVFDNALHFCSMPQAINHFLARGKKTLVVCGTHGKTTTSSLLAWVLHEAGLDPSYLIGGILNNFNSNFRIGHGSYLVLEGDEYDTAFFDKGPKFMHYNPDVTIMTSIEFDHADIFSDLDHVKRVFGNLIGKLKTDSLLVAHDSDDNISSLLNSRNATVERYGTEQSSHWFMDNITINPPVTAADVYRDGAFYGILRTRLPGTHNLLNALSVTAAAHRLGIPLETVNRALDTFVSVKRRQEIRGVKNGITVMDDFAHHPTAVRETIKAVRPFYPEGRLIAVFEPRTNSSMRNVFQKIYPNSFDGSDMVLVRKPPLLDKIPEEQRFSSERLVEELKEKGMDARYFETTEGIIEHVISVAKSGDLILVMSNGGFDNIHQRLLEQL